jgi:hypothetical protein
MTQSKRSWAVWFFLGGMYHTPDRWPRYGSHECAYEKQMAHPRALACQLHQKGPRAPQRQKFHHAQQPGSHWTCSAAVGHVCPTRPKLSMLQLSNPPVH